MVRKADLLNCQFLKVGVQVEFECHPSKTGLTAKKVKLKKAGGGKQGGNGNNGHGNDNRGNKQPFRFGVMQ
ncbi:MULTISPECIES: hypothetical protein [Dasania]|nr:MULTISPECIES: hypothetical protein [Dasania]